MQTGSAVVGVERIAAVEVVVVPSAVVVASSCWAMTKAAAVGVVGKVEKLEVPCPSCASETSSSSEVVAVVEVVVAVVVIVVVVTSDDEGRKWLLRRSAFPWCC